jgi:hypothetical protein
LGGLWADDFGGVVQSEWTCGDFGRIRGGQDLANWAVAFLSFFLERRLLQIKMGERDWVLHQLFSFLSLADVSSDN